MNKRIQEITGRVLDEVVPETWVALKYDKVKEIQNRTAELIVRECATLSWLHGGRTEVRDMMLTHFGVK